MYLQWCEESIVHQHAGRKVKVGLSQSCLNLIQDWKGWFSSSPSSSQKPSSIWKSHLQPTTSNTSILVEVKLYHLNHPRCMSVKWGPGAAEAFKQAVHSIHLLSWEDCSISIRMVFSISPVKAGSTSGCVVSIRYPRAFLKLQVLPDPDLPDRMIDCGWVVDTAVLYTLSTWERECSLKRYN